MPSRWINPMKYKLPQKIAAITKLYTFNANVRSKYIYQRGMRSRSLCYGSVLQVNTRYAALFPTQNH